MSGEPGRHPSGSTGR